MLELAAGLEARALADFERGEALAAEADRFTYRKTMTLLRLGRPAEAVPDLDRLVAKNPTQFMLHDLRSRIRAALGDAKGAAAARLEADRLLPAAAAALNHSAWPLLVGLPSRQDAERALALSRRAVELSDNPLYLNTYGVALCRAALYSEAVSALERSLAVANGETDGFDLVFLAIAHHHLGRFDRSRECFERALRWRLGRSELPATWKAELDNFEAEARAVMGLDLPDLPADVFAP